MSDTARRQATLALEGSFSEVMAQFRRVYAEAAEAASPGLLPATYKVLSLVGRAGPITVSGLADRLHADKGQLSRAVTELEGLGFVERTPDAVDGRVKLIRVTALGSERLAAARAPYETRLARVLEAWPVERIEQLGELLHALAFGISPAD